jgi:hypothetical protein
LKSSFLDLEAKAAQIRQPGGFEEAETASESAKRAAGEKIRRKVWKRRHEVPLGKECLPEERTISSQHDSAKARSVGRERWRRLLASRRA